MTILLCVLSQFGSLADDKNDGTSLRLLEGRYLYLSSYHGIIRLFALVLDVDFLIASV